MPIEFFTGLRLSTVPLLFLTAALPTFGAPTIISRTPAAGVIATNQTIEVVFSVEVTGLDASDLLVNGAPATDVLSSNGSHHTFAFAQPPEGTVQVSWANNHGITDTATPTPEPFDHTAPDAAWSYTYVDRTAPVILSVNPPVGSTLTNLTNVTVVFSEPVTGVNASDLRNTYTSSTAVEGSGAVYTFTFPEPRLGTVTFFWVSPGITDLAATPNAFNSTVPAARWSYTMDDFTPPAIAAVTPPPGSHVTNLTQVTVTFTDAVTNVNASDLLVNGRGAASVSGTSNAYVFTIATQNGSVLAFTWATNHNIRDLAPSANLFDATAPGVTWSYTTADSTPPSARIFPPPSATIRQLARVEATFDEPVTGVNAEDLLVNNVPVQELTGSGAGPYVFSFPEPPTGTVQMAFAAGHGIQDIAGNPFAGGSWSYTVDPSIPRDIIATRVVQISLDGLGAKYLERYLSNAPAQFPTFKRLTQESAYTLNARCDYEFSETVPNHITMFTGRPVAQPLGFPGTASHGYSNNFPTALETIHNSGNTNVPYKSSMFDVAHDYGRSTALYTGKTRLSICERSYNETHGAPDQIGEDNGRDKIDFASVADVSGAAISNEVNAVVADLSSSAPKQYSFIHIAEPDLTGHSSAWGSANWSNAVRMVDTQLARIIDAIDQNPVTAGQTALIITADHGGGGGMTNGHTASEFAINYTVPFFLRAPGIPGGSDLYSLFANRGNPGNNRTDYTTSPQPIRNGDGSNLALMLLGLPPIPGSFMTPAFADPEVEVTIARFEDRVAVFWSDPANEYVLEATAGLGGEPVWETISTEQITVSDTIRIYSITNIGGSPRFFRLKR